MLGRVLSDPLAEDEHLPWCLVEVGAVGRDEYGEVESCRLLRVFVNKLQRAVRKSQGRTDAQPSTSPPNSLPLPFTLSIFYDLYEIW